MAATVKAGNENRNDRKIFFYCLHQKGLSYGLSSKSTTSFLCSSLYEKANLRLIEQKACRYV